MELSDFIKCPTHGVYCSIQTNIHCNSPSYGKSYNFCGNAKQNNCSFRNNASVGVVKCPAHPNEIIRLRRLVVDEHLTKFYFQCHKNVSSWCGCKKLLIESESESKDKKRNEQIATAGVSDTKTKFNALKDVKNNIVISKLSANECKTSRAELEFELLAKKKLYDVNGMRLPDKGKKLLDQIRSLEDAILNWKPTKVVSNFEDDKSNLIPRNPEFVNSLNKGYATVLVKAHTLKYDYPVGNPLYVGPNNAARRQNIITVTLAAVERLHESLKSKPKEYEEETVANDLNVSLMEHQRQGLKWALWREGQHPPGGIIADEMGLGKTLLMIALIIKKKQMEIGGSPKLIPKSSEGKLLITGCTLIICPTTLMHHWEAEIINKCRKNLLSVIVYHGPRRTSSYSKLSLADVIITTYDTIRSELRLPKESEQIERSQSPLLRLSFCRIILDEGHVIKNPKTNTSQAVCRLHARNRWVLTGTPIHNCLKDMYSLLMFLRCTPFDELSVWRHWVDNGTVAGQSRLKSIVESLLLRRTKSQTGTGGKPLIVLPLKEKLDVILTLSADEREIYDEFLLRSQRTLVNLLKKKDSYVEGGPRFALPNSSKADSAVSSMVSRAIPDNANMAKVLVLLLRMQQCCCHLSLLKLEVAESVDDDVDDLAKQLEEMTLFKTESSKALLDKESDAVLNAKKVFPGLDKFFASTKLSALMEKLRSCLQSGKCVVVSQWSSFLDIIATFLREAKIEFCEISGRIPPKDRGEIVEKFNASTSSSKVMLLSLKAGGVGLNLTGGRYLFLMDIHWNPALEAQACDRIHRVGQKYDVKIFRFVCENTVEMKIIELHERKLKLANNVLDGNYSKNSRLTLQDLRMLFGV